MDVQHASAATPRVQQTVYSLQADTGDDTCAQCVLASLLKQEISTQLNVCL